MKRLIWLSVILLRGAAVAGESDTPPFLHSAETLNECARILGGEEEAKRQRDLRLIHLSVQDFRAREQVQASASPEGEIHDTLVVQLPGAKANTYRCHFQYRYVFDGLQIRELRIERLNGELFFSAQQPFWIWL